MGTVVGWFRRCWVHVWGGNLQEPEDPACRPRCIFALDEEGNPRPEGPILRVGTRRPAVEDLEALEALEDRMDVEEARRLLADPAEKPIPYEQVRQELGLE